MSNHALRYGATALVRVSHPAIDIDLAYASTQNFTGRVLYQDKTAWLQPKAAQALCDAADVLMLQGLRLVVLDAFRPVSVQRALWDFRPDPEFVADPSIGSDHSRGVAVDVTLSNGDARLDMGTDFDAALPQSHHNRSDIATQAIESRLALRHAMEHAGFTANPNEWWHYALAGAESYPILTR